MSPRGRPVSMPPSLSASGPISVTPRSSRPTDSSRSARARSASGLMCTREPLPSGCLRQISSKGARRIGADTCPAGRPVGRRLRTYATGSIAVPSPPHIPLACRAHQSECGPTAAACGRRKGGPASMDPHDRLGQPAPTSPARRHRPRAPSALKGRPWGTSSTPTSRTTWSGSSGPTAPPAAGPPISPPSSAATRGPPP